MLVLILKVLVLVRILVLCIGAKCAPRMCYGNMVDDIDDEPQIG